MGLANMNEKLKIFYHEYLPYIITIIIVLLIKKYVVSPIKVNGESMMNTLHDGDIMILDIATLRFNDIKRFDIVVIKEKHELIIKRVIGLPGEVVEYRDNKLYINGKQIKDVYASKVTNDFKYEVSDNSYFVLGDNRTNSMDSIVFGEFTKKEIIGKTKLTVFPFSRFGNKK